MTATLEGPTDTNIAPPDMEPSNAAKILGKTLPPDSIKKVETLATPEVIEALFAKPAEKSAPQPSEKEKMPNASEVIVTNLKTGPVSTEQAVDILNTPEPFIVERAEKNTVGDKLEEEAKGPEKTVSDAEADDFEAFQNNMRPSTEKVADTPVTTSPEQPVAGQKKEVGVVTDDQADDVEGLLKRVGSAGHPTPEPAKPSPSKGNSGQTGGEWSVDTSLDATKEDETEAATVEKDKQRIRDYYSNIKVPDEARLGNTPTSTEKVADASESETAKIYSNWEEDPAVINLRKSLKDLENQYVKWDSSRKDYSAAYASEEEQRKHQEEENKLYDSFIKDYPEKAAAYRRHNKVIDWKIKNKEEEKNSASHQTNTEGVDPKTSENAQQKQENTAESETAKIYSNWEYDPAVLELQKSLRSLEDTYMKGSVNDEYRAYTSLKDIRAHESGMKKLYQQFIDTYPEKAVAYRKYDANLDDELKLVEYFKQSPARIAAEKAVEKEKEKQISRDYANRMKAEISERLNNAAENSTQKQENPTEAAFKKQIDELRKTLEEQKTKNEALEKQNAELNKKIELFEKSQQELVNKIEAILKATITKEAATARGDVQNKETPTSPAEKKLSTESTLDRSIFKSDLFRSVRKAGKDAWKYEKKADIAESAMVRIKELKEEIDSTIGSLEGAKKNLKKHRRRFLNPRRYIPRYGKKYAISTHKAEHAEARSDRQRISSLEGELKTKLEEFKDARDAVVKGKIGRNKEVAGVYKDYAKMVKRAIKA